MRHGNAMYGIENIVNNIVTSLYGDRWYPDFRGDDFIIHVNVEPLCCTPETNKILYVNYTSIKKGRTRLSSQYSNINMKT